MSKEKAAAEPTRREETASFIMILGEVYDYYVNYNRLRQAK